MKVAGASAKPRFVYESLARRRSRPAKRDPLVVERHRRQRVERVPGRVLGNGRVDVGGHEPEVRGRELPFARVPLGVAERLQLLEVGEVAHVDLRCQVPANRLLELLAGGEVAARERPAAGVWILRALPEQDLQHAVAHLENDARATRALDLVFSPGRH